jgi:PhnB protein
LHEEAPTSGSFSPRKYDATTTTIGLFVSDVNAFMKQAIAAGAEEISAVQDYDYGYRLGKLKDPFGHELLIEMKI